MSEIINTPPSSECGTVTGTFSTMHLAGPHDPMLERTRSTWMAGDFGRIAVGYASGAASFVHRLSLAAGEKVLDVACGTGNLTIPAARYDAAVTGIDIAPNLVEAARRAAREAGLDIRFDVGTAESLPYEDESFDTVISMFGVMFAARPEPALSEMLRVARPGGRIVLASWRPEGFIGSVLRAHTALVPPPTGAPSSLAWGDAAVVRQRLEPFGSRVRALRCTPRTIELAFPLPPAGVVELFREFYGPSVRTFGALEAAGRATLSAELNELFGGRNRAGSDSTSVEAEYLEVQIDLA